MKTMLLLSIILLAFPAFGGPTDEEAKDATRDAIRQAALDYVDGFYAGDYERVERGVHPSLQKLMVADGPGGVEILQGMDRLALIEYARLGGERKPADERGIEVEIHAVYANIAAVRIDSSEFLDYAHVANVNGAWRVVNVLWAPHATGAQGAAGATAPATEPSAEDRSAIERVGLDYVDGFYAGSAERIGRALHPCLQKIAVRGLPNGREVFQYSTREGLVAYTGTGMGKKPADERRVEVHIHDVHANIAAIAVDSADFIDYAHAAKINGEWQIVNVLWAPRKSK